MYASVPGNPAYIFVNLLTIAESRLTPIRGCIMAWPFTTIPSFISGLFKICAIAPTSSSPVFSTNSVSASNVITYFIFGSFDKSIVFILNGFGSFFKMYSLNWFKSPLFRSQPR